MGFNPATVPNAASASISSGVSGRVPLHVMRDAMIVSTLRSKYLTSQYVRAIFFLHSFFDLLCASFFLYFLSSHQSCLFVFSGLGGMFSAEMLQWSLRMLQIFIDAVGCSCIRRLMSVNSLSSARPTIALRWEEVWCPFMLWLFLSCFICLFTSLVGSVLLVSRWVWLWIFAQASAISVLL